MEMVKVRYIGTRAERKDNVADTMAIWFGQDSVVEVPYEAAMKLFKFPTVWQAADKPVIERPDPDEEVVDELEAEAAAEAAAAADLAASTASDPARLEPSTDPDAPVLTEDDEHGFAKPEDPGPEVTIDELVESFSMLDKDQDFTQHNKPKMDVVRSLFENRKVTAQAVKLAWEKFSVPE